MQNTITLYRPIGPEELVLIEATDFKAFPPRLPEQPIFYPVLNELYAIEIARDWNVPTSGVGYVTKFEVNAAYVQNFPIQVVGAAHHQELWIPAEELTNFNEHIVGKIEIIQKFPEN